MAKDKDKKGSKDSAQEQKAPAQARHSAKERPRLRSKFEKEVAPALLKELELKNPMAVPRLQQDRGEHGHGRGHAEFEGDGSGSE